MDDNEVLFAFGQILFHEFKHAIGIDFDAQMHVVTLRPARFGVGAAFRCEEGFAIACSIDHDVDLTLLGFEYFRIGDVHERRWVVQ